MTERDRIQRELEQLEDELVDGLAAVLERDPEMLRDFLVDEGVIEGVAEFEEPELTEAERTLLDIMESVGNPKSSEEIQEVIEIEHPEKLAEYGSLRHRSWISDKLNSLAKKGFVGKYREGRRVKFTQDPTEAVSRWALHNNKFDTELTRSDADEIVADTGMQSRAVRRAIDSLREDP